MLFTGVSVPMNAKLEGLSFISIILSALKLVVPKVTLISF